MSITSKKQMINLKFGLFTVLNEVENRNKNGCILYNVICECGNKKTVLGSSLRNGSSKACNNCKHKLTGTHGKYKTKEYKTWKSMRFRCDAKNNYKNYSLKGITVCDEWNDFNIFLKDMGLAPTKKHSIDRINVYKGYNKNNCRWATDKVQARNRTNNKLIEYNGQVKCISEWCEGLNMPYNTFSNRLKRGWSIEKTIKTPINKKNRSKNL